MTDLKFTNADGVLEIQIARPQKKNALTFPMYDLLTNALENADRDDATRAVLLTGTGDVFCAGNDISDFFNLASIDIDAAPPVRFIEALVKLEKPLVAAVAGRAVGVGATLLLHCDLVYASESALLSMPFVSLGLVPEAASSLLLPLRVGHVVANEMLLLGAAIDARRAASLGLVNEVVASPEAALTLARSKATELAGKPPRAIRATKTLLRGDRKALLARVKEESRLFAEGLVSTEAREAFAAFLERRAASFAKTGAG